MAEPPVGMSIITKMLMGAISILCVIMVSLVGWGISAFNDSFERSLTRVEAQVVQIGTEVTTISTDVRFLLVNEPRITDLERRMGNIEAVFEAHRGIEAHDNHPHPINLQDYLKSLELITGTTIR